MSGVTVDGHHRLVGTTNEGGASGYGTIYQLSPPGNGQPSWSPTVLHSFTGADDGSLQRSIFGHAATQEQDLGTLERKMPL
jgi:uncharacterized repeat protein (TIGR03803 family)